MQLKSDDLTVLILTFNEEANLSRTLGSIRWVERILIIDSFSTDRTYDIASKYSQVEIFQRRFSDFTDQWNYGLSKIRTNWVLTLDADYVLPGSACDEITEAMQRKMAGYSAKFEYCINGKPVKGSILPPRIVLFQTDLGSYFQDGHTQKVKVTGNIEELGFRISHDDRKSLTRWFSSQVRYAREEAEKLAGTPNSGLRESDRVRRSIVFAPPLVFIITYVLRGGFLSGFRGLFYALQRLLAECLLSLFMLEKKIKNREIER